MLLLITFHSLPCIAQYYTKYACINFILCQICIRSNQLQFRCINYKAFHLKNESVVKNCSCKAEIFLYLLECLLSCTPTFVFKTKVRNKLLSCSLLQSRTCNSEMKFLSEYIHTYIHTYVRTYIRTYIHTYIHTYICSRVQKFPV